MKIWTAELTFQVIRDVGDPDVEIWNVGHCYVEIWNVEH